MRVNGDRLIAWGMGYGSGVGSAGVVYRADTTGDNPGGVLARGGVRTGKLAYRGT